MIQIDVNRVYLLLLTIPEPPPPQCCLWGTREREPPPPPQDVVFGVRRVYKLNRLLQMSLQAESAFTDDSHHHHTLEIERT